MQECCGEVLWRSVVAKCCREVLWRSVVERSVVPLCSIFLYGVVLDGRRSVVVVCSTL